MTNILEAIVNIINTDTFDVQSSHEGNNRMNTVGEGLEKYIKDAFADTILETDEQIRLLKYAQIFSWYGTQNNPPDIMIRNGDAIEVKKISGNASSIALNSSHPKDKMYSDNHMVTHACRTCENWVVKDLIYCIGNVTANTEKLNSLWMFYGDIYAANKQTYERIKNAISDGVIHVPNVAFSETKELGRVNKVDPLSITDLRMRGMWQIQNPKKVFEYVYQTKDADFELIAIIPTDKYNTFPQNSRTKLENINVDGFDIVDTKVKNPNNPAQLIACKLIKLTL